MDIQRYSFDGDCIEPDADGGLVHWDDIERLVEAAIEYG